jgi:hypothetical protein
MICRTVETTTAEVNPRSAPFAGIKPFLFETAHSGISEK